MNPIQFTNLGLKPYNEVWQYQKNWLKTSLEKKKSGDLINQEVLFVEHSHVYTLGKSANTANLLVNQSFLKSIQAESYQIERGGDITYHGPGQLVVYPLLDLESQKMGVKDYVQALESCIIHTLADYNISSARVEGKTGIWLDAKTANERKIAAIGIKCSRFLTIHGLALNINTDLEYFNHIVPCGLSNSAVTSLAKEVNRPIELKEIIDKFQTHFTSSFNL